MNVHRVLAGLTVCLLVQRQVRYCRTELDTSLQRRTQQPVVAEQ